MYKYQRLKDLRVDQDKTQKEIANIINTTFQYYSAYERGIRDIPFSRIIQLAKYYNVTIDYIAGLTNDPTPHWTIKNDNSNNNNKTVNIRQNGNKNSVGDINL